MERAEAQSYYFTLQLNITNLCNLRCEHCYHDDHKPHGSLRTEDYCHIVTKYLALCKKWTVKPHLILCGGEPLLSRDLHPVCTSYDAQSQGGELSLLTNATLATPERIKPLTAFNVRMVQVSLDGACASTHDRIRGHGSFDRTMRGIAVVRQHGLFVSMNVVLSQRNVAEIPALFSLARQRGVARLTFQRFIPTGIGAHVRTQLLSPYDLRAAYQQIHAFAVKNSIQTNFNDGLFTLIDHDLGHSSPVGYTAMVVADDGSILFSSRVPLVIGNALTDDLAELWLHHPLLTALRDRTGHECHTCPHFNSCGGGNEEMNFAYWGQFHRTDPQCWRRFDTLPPSAGDTVAAEGQHTRAMQVTHANHNRLVWRQEARVDGNPYAA